MIKRLLSTLLSLAVILSLVLPITAAAADDGIMTVGTGATAADPYELPEEAFLWEKSGEKTTLIGVSPTWYKTHVKDQNIKYVSVKIPATTVKINRCFAGAYGSSNSGYNSAGTQEDSTNISGELVAVDFSQAVALKTIDVQAFGYVSNLTGVIDLSNTKVEEILGNAFKGTAITGVILPTTLKRVGNDNANSSGDASVFGQCKNLAYIRVAGGDLNAVLELPSSLQLIGYTGFLLDGTKIEQTMKTNPFVIKIPASVTEMQHTAIGFDDRTAIQKAQYIFEKTDFTDTEFQNDCLFNSLYKSNWGVARFASKDAYDSFVTKYPDSSKFYGYPTYEFALKFKDTAIEQPKLWGLSIQYEKNDTTNYWTLNTSYALPTAPTGQEPAAGQVGYWDLNGDELKADSKLPAAPVETELTAVWTVVEKLAEPTISYTVNGEDVGEVYKVFMVPYVNGQPGKIGVKASHPLLKSENGTDDNYVYFKYRWLDSNYPRLGARSQNIEAGSGFYNNTTQTPPSEDFNEITIRNSDDDRSSGYNFYNCEIYGYHVKGGVEKLFYASNKFAPYLRVTVDSKLANTANDYYYIQAKFLDVWTVTFDLNGGAAPAGKDFSPKQVKKGNGFTLSDEPVKVGYTFDVWTEKDGTGVYWTTLFFEPKNDTTLVAQYIPNKYTIRYNANLADATGTVDAQEYTYDTADFKLTTDTFTSTTKDFLGWSLTADSTTATYASGAAIDDALKAAMTASADETVTLYAVWEDKPAVSMTFNAGEGAFAGGEKEKVESVRPGAQNALPAAPTRAGYTFDGWTAGSGDYPDLGKDATQTPVAVGGKNVTYSAKFVPNTYTIRYNANLADASGTVDAQEYTYDTADFKLTTETFASTAKDFLGWSLTADVTTADYVPGAAINDALKAAMVASADGTVTLYAVWKDKTTHTVTFNAGTNGSFANTSDPLIRQVVIEGLSVTGVPAVTANSGYRFDGWKLEGDTTGKVYTADEVRAMSVTADKTFTASYTYVWVPPVINNKPATPAKPDMTDPKETGVADLLETTLHNAYMHGYGNGEFGPNRGMTRAEVAQMFYNLLRSKDVSITAHFVDVPEDAWFATAVNTLSSLGILDGIGNEMYDPDRVITRGEFAAIATRFAKANNNGNVSFEDVSAADWFYNAVLTAANYGWIDGYEDNTFKPYSTITRAEVTTIVNRMLARRADKDFVADHIHNMRTFSDVDNSFWAYHYIMEVTNGHDYDRVEHTEIWKSPTAQ